MRHCSAVLSRRPNFRRNFSVRRTPLVAVCYHVVSNPLIQQSEDLKLLGQSQPREGRTWPVACSAPYLAHFDDPASRPFLSPRLRLPAGAVEASLVEGLASMHAGQIRCIRFGLHLATKAVKPATTPSATGMAVGGPWREAWDSALFTCCTGHRVPLPLER